eukprot:gene10657-3281_t
MENKKKSTTEKVEEALLTIAGYPSTQFYDITKLLSRIITNIKKDPEEMKFRKIAIAKISNSVWAFKGSRLFLFNVGFKEVEKHIVLEKTGKEIKKIEFHLDFLKEIIEKKQVLDKQLEIKQKIKLKSMKRVKENKRKIENTNNCSIEFNLKEIKPPQLTLAIDEYLKSRKVEFEEVLLDSGSSTKHPEEQLINFNLSKSTKYNSGKIIVEWKNNSWKIIQLLTLEK